MVSFNPFGVAEILRKPTPIASGAIYLKAFRAYQYFKK